MKKLFTFVFGGFSSELEVTSERQLDNLCEVLKVVKSLPDLYPGGMAEFQVGCAADAAAIQEMNEA